MKRTEIYKLIDGEREYQDKKWNSSTTTSDGQHSVEEWLLYIHDYVHEAMHIHSRKAKQVADVESMEIIRKIAGMAVCAMEQHEASPRKFTEEIKYTV